MTKIYNDLLKDISYESLNENMLVEGLIVNNIERTVKLTDNHNKGMDISLINNHVYYKYKGFDVISIFKRTSLVDNENTNYDGNPFIYALKEVKGWKFDMSYSDIVKYIRRFLQITEKLKGKHFDTVITIPSSFDINNKFMKVLSEHLHIENKINDYFYKVEKDDAWQWIDRDEIEAYCKKKYSKEQVKVRTTQIMRSIYRGFKRMKTKYFESKYVHKEYLQFIHEIVTVNKDYEIDEIANLIDDKDIIILDDTISSGHTISEYTNALLKTFNPKSVNIVTLLSKRFK